MEQSIQLSSKFSGIGYGTWKYGLTQGPYLREPFWKSYTEFHILWQQLSQTYQEVEVYFPIEKSAWGKLQLSQKKRRKGLERFLRECLVLPNIWENVPWLLFVNPLKLPVNLYFANSYHKLSLIEWSKNVDVYLIRSNFRHYAIKSIDLKGSFHPQLLNEVLIHQSLQYKHCLKFHGYKLENARLNLVLEVAEQSLLEALEGTNGFEEDEARNLFYQIILGVLYLHHHGLCHRDLKPQNILLMRNMIVKICDFGYTHFQGRHSTQRRTTNLESSENPLNKWLGESYEKDLHNTNLPTASCGTLFYVAPEVVGNGSYDGKTADLYSCGQVLFRLLGGSRPSNESTFGSFSSDAQDLIRQLLREDPQTRCQIQEILTHPWLASIVRVADLEEIVETPALELDLPIERDVVTEMAKLAKQERVERKIHLSAHKL